ncbi:hypothetical protein F5I97DRAFT_1814490 [Phlebopus sp. FC_14]|nr:hypothetical protein F5I97DRAFT_1814490 [Phlebopus sp. FC_14]
MTTETSNLAIPRQRIHIPGFEDVVAFKATLDTADTLSLVKKSPLFGKGTDGPEFDAGAYGLPLKKVSFSFSQAGLSSIQAHYEEHSTELFGSHNPENEVTLELQPDEYITGISGVASETVTDLVIHTSARDVHIGTTEGSQQGTPFSYRVPDDHAVVTFSGNAGKLGPHAFGTAYGQDNSRIQVLEEQFELTTSMEQAIRRGDSAYIEGQKARFQDDLRPMYDKIKRIREHAFEKVEIEGTGEIWYAVITDNEPASSLVIFTRQRGSERFMAMTTYSGGTQLRSEGGWTWNNLSDNVPHPVMSLAVRNMIPYVYTEGVTAKPQQVATLFQQSLNNTGNPEAQRAARKVAGSATLMVATTVIATAIWTALQELWGVVFRDYRLNIVFSNYDENIEWKVTKYHHDNGSWPGSPFNVGELPKCKKTGAKKKIPGHDGSTGTVTKTTPGQHSYTINNYSTAMQGVGIAMIVAREDILAGFAIKYDVRYARDNAIGLKGPINPNTFNLRDYFENGEWKNQLEDSIRYQDGGRQILVRGGTNALNGAPQKVYTYNVLIN